MSRVVCVWLPNWPLQRLRHERSELKARPVVIYSTAGRRGAEVVTCSPAAARQGVVANIPLAEAQALCATANTSPTRKRGTGNSFPSLARRASVKHHFERHDPASDVAALREQARMCEAFSPLFGIEPADSPECLLLDVAGCSHLLGGEQSLADAVADKFRRRGFQTRVALAPTIGAAWAAAHFLAKANDQPVLRESQLATALAPLPVTALRLPFKTIEMLHELGLRQIGQLRALPRASVPSRLGTVLLQRLDQAFGDAPELLIPECPPEPIEATWAAEDSLADRESLRFVCRELLDQLLHRLTPRREGVRQLLCQIKGAETRPLELVVNLVSPSNVGPHLLELLSLQFERTALPEAVSFVRLEATAIASLAARPRDLFGFESDGDEHREVAGLLDRLSSRLGSQAVVRARLLPEAQPELAVAYEPCAVASARAMAFPQRANANTSPTRQRGTEEIETSTPTDSALGWRVGLVCSPDSFPSPLSQGTTTSRPLRLFAPPQPIEVSIAGPEGAPLRFRWERREHRVIRSWGPERIETGWWREESIHRDYFRVEVHTGQRFWLFRCLKELVWFIHGAFD